MPQFMFANFLTSPAEYAAAERFWQELFARVAREEGVEGEWVTPWLNTRFADGTPFGDGNPIFSAWSPARRIAVRVIQHDPADLFDQEGFDSWTDTFDGEGGAVRELVISCVLSDAAADRSAKLLRSWIGRLGSGYVPASA
jgi:hypothetical protein